MRVYLDSCALIYRIEQRAHLAAALCAGCQQFITNDNRLAAAAAGRLEVHALSA